MIREVQQQQTTIETPLSTLDTRSAGGNKVTEKTTVLTKSPGLQDPLTKNQIKITDTPVIGTQTTLSPYKIEQTTNIQTEPTLTTQMHILQNITHTNQPRKTTYQSVGTLSPVHPGKTPAEIVDTHASTGQTAKQQNTYATEQGPSPEAHYVVSEIDKTTSLPVTSKLSTIKTTMKQTTTIQNGLIGKQCVDVGIWIGSGSVSCDFLFLDNKHRINEDPLYFCNRYPLTSCCNTCAMINSMIGQ